MAQDFSLEGARSETVKGDYYLERYMATHGHVVLPRKRLWCHSTALPQCHRRRLLDRGELGYNWHTVVGHLLDIIYSTPHC